MSPLKKIVLLSASIVVLSTVFYCFFILRSAKRSFVSFKIVENIALNADKDRPIAIAQFLSDYFGQQTSAGQKRQKSIPGTKLLPYNYKDYIQICGTFNILENLSSYPFQNEHVEYFPEVSFAVSNWPHNFNNSNFSIETLLPQQNQKTPTIVVIIKQPSDSTLLESTFIGPIAPENIKEISIVARFIMQEDFNTISYEEAQKMLSAQEYWEIFVGLARIKAIEKQNLKEHSLEIDNILIEMGLNDDSVKSVKSKGTLTILDNAKIALIEKNLPKDWTIPKTEQFLNQMNKEKIKAVDYFRAMRNLPPICRMDITNELFKEATVNPNVKNELVSELRSFIKTALPAQQEPVLIEINKLLTAEIYDPASSLDTLYAQYNSGESTYDNEYKIKALEDFLKRAKYNCEEQNYTQEQKEFLVKVKKIVGTERWKWNIKNCLEPRKELADALNRLEAKHAENKEYEKVIIQYKQLKALLNKTR